MSIDPRSFSILLVGETPKEAVNAINNVRGCGSDKRESSCCCFGLMAILLVIGVIDLRAMAVVMIPMTVERLAPAGERIAIATGAVAVESGFFLLAPATGLGYSIPHGVAHQDMLQRASFCLRRTSRLHDVTINKKEKQWEKSSVRST